MTEIGTVAKSVQTVATAGEPLLLEEADPLGRMTTKLINAGIGSQAMRLEPNPHLQGHIIDKAIMVDCREVHACIACDQLVFFKRGDRYSPVLFEQVLSASNPFSGGKLEQLFCTLPLLEYDCAHYAYTLNGKIPVEAPRFVLVCKNGKAGLSRNRSYFAQWHQSLPRVVMRARILQGRMPVFYYGGANKIIQVAVASVADDGILDTRDVFASLPTADPPTRLSATLRAHFRSGVDRQLPGAVGLPAPADHILPNPDLPRRP